MEPDGFALESPSSSSAGMGDKGCGGGGRESVAAVVQDLIRELKATSGRADGRDALQRYRDAVVDKAPRLNRSLKFLSADLFHWMNRGGQWRAFAILSTGLITLVGLASLFVFLLVLITATVNVVIVALLASVAAVGAVTALFFAAIAAIYIGVLTVATIVICTIAFFTIGAVVMVSGWIAFWWAVWLGAKRLLQMMQGSLAMITTSTIQTVSSSGINRVVPIDKKEE